MTSNEKKEPGNLVANFSSHIIFIGDHLASLESPRRPLILDVRSAQEWSHDHLEGAVHTPLPQLLRQIGGISRNAPLTVVCGSGYRSSIAASLLEWEGFERLV